MDIELLNVQATSPLLRSLASDDDSYTLDQIETHYGNILVAKQGADHKQNKPVILTYHDIGLNHVSNFQAFFNYMDMRLFLQSFAVIHINAPGQEENAAPLPESFVYPTMDQLAEQIEAVCKFYGIKNFIGFGVGAGANILSRFALRNPGVVDGLYLVNCTASQSSWSEYLYQKMNVYYLTSTAALVSSTTFPQSVQDYLLWYHFGRVTEERNRDLIAVYSKYFSGQSINPRNLSLFIDSYIRRTDLGIIRGDKEKNFKCSVLLLCANLSPHVDDTVNMNSRLNPENSTWMKLSDSGMALEEQPGKVAEAMKLFIQGLGYALTVYERRRSSLRKMSLNSSERPDSVDSSRKNSIDNSLDTQIVDGRLTSGESPSP
ncbi:protein NDRG3-like [Panonychus citri]|uniref:protein NDRG3-like n=1 Tax=Panonychus citri TaxID=50023 RepID=UPI00230779E2|nr:protein NDRG3-like [Panonychus citri]